MIGYIRGSYKTIVENLKDISIGQDKWIKWIEPDQNTIAFAIDAEIKPTEQLWRFLETQCVSACCGIDAFGLWPDDLKKAKTLLANPTIKQEFIDLKEKIMIIDKKVISSSLINNVFDKSVFIELVDHVIDHLSD